MAVAGRGTQFDHASHRPHLANAGPICADAKLAVPIGNDGRWGSKD